MFGIESNKNGNKGIYKDTLFLNADGTKMSMQQQKTLRRKVRAQFLIACKQLISLSGSEFEKLANAFIADYKNTFALTDFSVASVSESKNTENLQLFANALAKVKAFADKSESKSKKQK